MGGKSLDVKLEQYAPDVWIVDGPKVRLKHIDFTLVANWLDEDYVPEGEIWLDRDAKGRREYPLTLVNERAEIKAFQKGMKKEAAERAGDDAERHERELLWPDRFEAHGPVQMRLIGTVLVPELVQVELVSGMAVRTQYTVGFVEGANDMAREWMPKRRIWIDDSVVPKERLFIVLHEAAERKVMKTKRMAYDRAHETVANVLELSVRKDPSRLDKELSLFGWQPR